jgi:hypothetical protein
MIREISIHLPLSSLDFGGQAPALDVVHGVKGLAVQLPNFVDGHDVRMTETGGGLGFAAKTLESAAPGEFSKENHLDGDDPVEAALTGLVNQAHPAACDFFEQFIVAKACSCGG